MNDIAQDILDEIHKASWKKKGPPLHHKLADWFFERGEITEEKHREMKESKLAWVDKQDLSWPMPDDVPINVLESAKEHIKTHSNNISVMHIIVVDEEGDVWHDGCALSKEELAFALMKEVNRLTK